MKKEELIKHLHNLPKNADVEIAIRSAAGNTLKIRNIIRVRQVRDQAPSKTIARLVCCSSLHDEAEQLEITERNQKQRQQAKGKRNGTANEPKK